MTTFAKYKYKNTYKEINFFKEVYYCILFNNYLIISKFIYFCIKKLPTNVRSYILLIN